jgi:hypothetical protein
VRREASQLLRGAPSALEMTVSAVRSQRRLVPAEAP